MVKRQNNAKFLLLLKYPVLLRTMKSGETDPGIRIKTKPIMYLGHANGFTGKKCKRCYKTVRWGDVIYYESNESATIKCWNCAPHEEIWSEVNKNE